MAIDISLGNNANDIPKGMFVPTKILENGTLSPSSEAYFCFVGQKFSANLQAYLINYVISISDSYSVYG